VPWNSDSWCTIFLHCTLRHGCNCAPSFFRHKNTGQNHNIKIGNEFSENVTEFRYLDMTVTKQNCVHLKIKPRLYSRNVCFHSVSSVLASRHMFKIICTKLQLYPLHDKGMNLGLLLWGKVLKMSKNIMVSRVFLQEDNEVLHNLLSSPNVVKFIWSMGMGRVGHVERMGRLGLGI
jgi:hypothetical protein